MNVEQHFLIWELLKVVGIFLSFDSLSHIINQSLQEKLLSLFNKYHILVCVILNNKNHTVVMRKKLHL